MFLIFDTETTGLPKDFKAPLTDFDNWPRLVQLAWQLHDDKGHLIESQNLLVKPEGFTIPYNAEKIHGISNKLANEQGLDLAEVLEVFNAAINQATFIVGHNIEFDRNIVGCELLRKEIGSDLLDKEGLDTKSSATQYCQLPGGKGGRFKFPTLSELHYKLFGEPFEDAHNAAADVEATARSFFKLVDLGIIQHESILIDKDIMAHLAEIAPSILDTVAYQVAEKATKTLKLYPEADGQEIEGAFCHLHAHSQYSVLQSTAELNAMIARAKEDNMPAVALTDIGNLYGAFKFVEAARKNKLLPILGCELNVCRDHLDHSVKDDGGKVVFLAKNKKGYHNLARLSSIAMSTGFYYVPRISRSVIEENKSDLMVLSGSVFGEIPGKILNEGVEKAEESVKWWKEQFGDDFYLELNRHGLDEEAHVNKTLLDFAQKYDIKTIATNDTYYIDKEDDKAHDILLCVKAGKELSQPKKYIGRLGREYRFGFPNDQFYYKSQKEMKALFADIPDSITNVQEIVDKVTSYSLKSDVLLPKFGIPEEFENKKDEEDGGKRGENNYLRHLTYEGATKRYPELTDDIRERIDFELATIEKTGYPGYFLIVQDFCHQARSMGISVGPGRGSAAGSVVAYCTQITNVDPIKYDLLFERFLNPERVSLPDIDIDFDDIGRQDIIDWVVERYGKDQVSQIITYGTMAAKSSLKDTARALGMDFADAGMLAGLVPDTSLKKIFGPEKDLKGKLNSEGMEKARQLIEIANTDTGLKGEVVNLAQVLEGSLRNTGIHACGVIIAPSKLTDHVPMAKTKDNNFLATQFDNSVVEDAGLLKMDFLGLKTLSILNEAVSLIKELHGVEINLDEISLEDPKTFELYQKGETNGTFQFESDGMQKYLRELKPDRFEDLIAMNALYRPGPLEYIPNFVARKNGKEDITYDCPEMEEFLGETFGITVYQEQVMRLSQKLAGFSKGEADMLRKGMGKKKKEILDELQPKFFDGCQENGISEEVCKKIWGDWQAFASYAFNKSHATCYSVIAFHTAFLKANYPAEYMSAVLSSNMNDIKKLTFFMEECHRMGLDVLGPDVNESVKKFTVNAKGQIRFGLGGVKGVGESAVEAIVEERKNDGPFETIWDFTKRVNLRAVNKKCMESLALAGGFDLFTTFSRRAYFEPALISSQTRLLDVAVRYGQQVKELQSSASTSLFGEEDGSQLAVPKTIEQEEWPLTVKLNKEKEVVGTYISGHPLDNFGYEIKHYATSDFGKIMDEKEGTYWIAGIVSMVNERISKKGSKYGQVVIDDHKGSQEFYIYGEAYLKICHLFNVEEILFLKVSLEKDRFRNDDLTVKIKEAMLMLEARKTVPKELKLELDLQQLSEQTVQELIKLINDNPGNASLEMSVKSAADKLSLGLYSKSRKVEISNELLVHLNQMDSINYSISKTI